MKITILGCDIHGRKEPRAAVDVINVRGLLSHRYVRRALCAECSERYWQGTETVLCRPITNEKKSPRRLAVGEAEKRLLHALARFKAPTPCRQVARAAGLTTASAQRAAGHLRERKLIRTVGIKRTAKWVLRTKGREEAKRAA